MRDTLACDSSLPPPLIDLLPPTIHLKLCKLCLDVVVFNANYGVNLNLKHVLLSVNITNHI